MAISDKRKSSKGSKSTSANCRRRAEFGDIIAEVYVSLSGKGAGEVKHSIRHRNHFYTGMNLDFIASMEACGVSWGSDVEKAFVQVDTWLCDKALLDTLKAEYRATLTAPAVSTPSTGGLAARRQSQG